MDQTASRTLCLSTHYHYNNYQRFGSSPNIAVRRCTVNAVLCRNMYVRDYYPEGGVTETSISCQSRGCCWNSSASPSCFYPDGFGYAMNGALSEESYGTVQR
eukprot:Em0005g544a